MKAARLCSAVLLVLFLGLYIAAKIHFFTRYFRASTASYLREHSIIWAAMAALALLSWLVERLFAHQDRS